MSDRRALDGVNRGLALADLRCDLEDLLNNVGGDGVGGDGVHGTRLQG